jgi:ribonuclease Z
LARILALRSKLLKGVPHKPLLVIGPRPLERFLNAYSTLEHLDMQFLDCRHTLKSSVEAFLSENDTDPATPQLETTMFAPGTRMENYNRKPASPRDTTALANFKEVLQESGLEILYSVPVLHCPQAFGVVLKAMEKANSTGKVIPGWKVVYSGDTRPCPGLIDASRDATVLIHEVSRRTRSLVLDISISYFLLIISGIVVMSTSNGSWLPNAATHTHTHIPQAPLYSNNESCRYRIISYR